METWKKIDGFSNYIINSDGRVVNIKTGKDSKQYLSDGTKCVSICSDDGIYKTRRISKLLFDTFHRPQSRIKRKGEIKYLITKINIRGGWIDIIDSFKIADLHMDIFGDDSYETESPQNQVVKMWKDLVEFVSED